MSQLSSSNQAGDVVQKQGANVYTWMLVLSFIATTIGAILLYLELQQYGDFPWWKPPRTSPTPDATSHLDVLPSPSDYVG